MARSKYEIKAQKYLEKEGWKVDWKIRPRFPTRTYSVDYFNLFDLLAYKAGECLRFIAIKGHGGVPSELRVSIFKFLVPGVIKEIWTFGRKNIKREIVP
jgi:hypothetical protein